MVPIVVAHGKLNVKQKWTETPPSENGGKKARKVVLTQGSPRSWGGAIPFVVSRRSACVDFKPRLSKRKNIGAPFWHWYWPKRQVLDWLGGVSLSSSPSEDAVARGSTTGPGVGRCGFGGHPPSLQHDESGCLCDGCEGVPARTRVCRPPMAMGDGDRVMSLEVRSGGGGRGRYKGIGNRTVGGSWVPEGIFGLNFAM